MCQTVVHFGTPIYFTYVYICSFRAPFTDREDHELFTIDTAPDEKNLEKYEDLKKERRHAILSRAPRCFQVLQPDSKVPDPISKR